MKIRLSEELTEITVNPVSGVIFVNPWLVFSMFLTGCAAVLLLWAALHDLAARTVPNALPAAIAAIGICVRLIDHSILLSLAAACITFTALFFCWRLGAIGGGDVKLWSASVLLIPGHWQTEFSGLTSILLAGGILALVYLALRLVIRRPSAAPSGRPAGAGFGILGSGIGRFVIGRFIKRILRAEAWRISRKAPLPYAFAIAGGTIVTLLPLPLSALR